jgi:hypothetical protein
MIRRHAGDEFELITQSNHALLSGQMAAYFGNPQFAAPAPLPETLAAIALHDCGWPAHDSAPTLNQDGQPLDVFESPLALGVTVWSAAVERAGRASPYTQLLVSLHVFGLSAFAATSPRSRREMFELNQFQQRQIETQEQLRRRLDMVSQSPLRFGLAMNDDVPAEAQLRHNHNVLQIMDRLSLALCCTDPPFTQIERITARPGPERLTLELERAGPAELLVHPWPFNRPRIGLTIACRPVPAVRYPDQARFRQAYDSAPQRSLELIIRSR